MVPLIGIFAGAAKFAGLASKVASLAKFAGLASKVAGAAGAVNKLTDVVNDSYRFVAAHRKVELNLNGISKNQKKIYTDLVQKAIDDGVIDVTKTERNGSIILKGLTSGERKKLEESISDVTLKAHNVKGKNNNGVLAGTFNMLFHSKKSNEFEIKIDSAEAVKFANLLQEKLENGDIKAKYKINVTKDGDVQFDIASRSNSVAKEMAKIYEESGYDNSPVVP